MRAKSCGLVGLMVLCAGCRSPRELGTTGDPVLRDFMVAGATAHAQQDAARAERAFRSALTRAELTDNVDGIRGSAQNLAVVMLEAGSWAEARDVLLEAEAHAGTPSAIAEIRTLQARCDIGNGDLFRARQTLEEMLDDSAGIASPVLFRARLLLAELAVRTGDLDEARLLTNALSQPGTGAEEARRHRLLATLAVQEDDAVTASEAHEREADAWKSVGDWRAMALALENAGNQLHAQGQFVPAVETWLRAARSLVAQGEGTRARDILTRCEQSGAENVLLMSRVQRLLAELESTP